MFELLMYECKTLFSSIWYTILLILSPIMRLLIWLGNFCLFILFYFFNKFAYCLIWCFESISELIVDCIFNPVRNCYSNLQFLCVDYCLFYYNRICWLFPYFIMCFNFFFMIVSFTITSVIRISWFLLIFFFNDVCLVCGVFIWNRCNSFTLKFYIMLLRVISCFVFCTIRSNYYLVSLFNCCRSLIIWFRCTRWTEVFVFELALWIIVGFTIICGPDSIFDLSDFNCSAAIWLCIVVLVIIIDNWVNSRDGQVVSNDRVLLFLTSSYWVTFDLYLRVIVIVFCFHCLIPLEADFFELCTLYVSILNWYTVYLCCLLLLFFFVICFILVINININWFGYVWGNIIFCLGCVLILFIFAMITWGLLFNSYSGYSFTANDSLLYLQNSNNFIYNSSLFVYDNFDWHMDQNFDFSIRFEQLYMFCFQFFNICILWNCLFLFIYVWGYALFVTHEVLSYNYFINGFILIWWENCGWWLYCGLFSYLLVGCRLLYLQTIEHNYWLV